MEHPDYTITCYDRYDDELREPTMGPQVMVFDNVNETYESWVPPGTGHVVIKRRNA